MTVYGKTIPALLCLTAGLMACAEKDTTPAPKPETRTQTEAPKPEALNLTPGILNDDMFIEVSARLGLSLSDIFSQGSAKGKMDEIKAEREKICARFGVVLGEVNGYSGQLRSVPDPNIWIGISERISLRVAEIKKERLAEKK